MRKFIITVNGNEYEVDVEEVGGGVSAAPRKAMPKQAPTTVEKPTPAAAPTPAPAKEEPAKEITVSAGEESIESPMPGTILSVNVSEGDSVAEGDTLMILEAMKMENEILAPRAGVVKAIGASEGAAVNTGDKLVVIE